MEFRVACDDDLEDLLIFRNDPLSRKMSLNHSKISLAKHRAWFEKQKNSKQIEIFFCQNNTFDKHRSNGCDEQKIGVVRIEVNNSANDSDNRVQISYIINPKCREKGYANEMIAKFLTFRPDRYYALVLKKNTASIKVLKKNNFHLAIETDNVLEFRNYKD